MRALLKRCTAVWVAVCLAAQAAPPRPTAAVAQTAGNAAGVIPETPSDFLATGAMRAYAHGDTTEFEFPEEDRKHLARDITVFVIVSVFVAYFIVKVFIEKDEGETESPPSGKPLPSQ